LLKRKTESKKPAESVNDRESLSAAIACECVGEQSTNTTKAQRTAANVRVKENIEFPAGEKGMLDPRERREIFCNSICESGKWSASVLVIFPLQLLTLSEHRTHRNHVSQRYLPRVSCRYR